MVRRISALVALAASAACGGGMPAPPDAGHAVAHAQTRDRFVRRSASRFPALVWMVKESPATAPMLDAAVQPGDYISTSIARAQPALVARVGGWAYVYGSSDSSATGATPPPSSMQYALARCPTGQVQFYDGEHWGATPRSQQIDPAGAILSAAAQAHATPPCRSDGFASYASGATPDGIFEGWSSCSYDAHSSAAFYNELADGLILHRPIGGTTWTGSDWASLDFYNAQAQTLLSQTPWDQCYGSVSFWLSAVQDRFAAARSNNPNALLWAEYSFGNETETMIAQAMQAAAAAPIPPDGNVIEYPITPTPRPECPDPYAPPTPAPHSWTTRCTFAVPERLQHLMYLLGRPTPSPAPG